MKSFRAFFPLILSAVLIAAIAAPARADFEDEQKLLAGDGATADLFGNAVAVDANVALVGAPGADDNGSDSGAAYVFTRTGGSWTEQVKLLAGDGAAGDAFGSSVALDGKTILVGAPGDDDNGSFSGSAYVFRKMGTTWTQEAKLLPGDGAAFDSFGFSASTEDNVALVGANTDSDNGPNSGSAYVFTRKKSAWAEQAKLLPGDGAADDFFGFSVASEGSKVLVGAPGDDDNGSFSGSAYVFERQGSSWTQQAKLLAGDGAASDSFGRSVALESNTALVGAPLDDGIGVNSGSAYVFTRKGSSWTQQAKLLAGDAATADNFGTSVALEANTALVGAPFDDDKGNGAGSAYVFTRSGTWTQDTKLLASDGATSDQFGTSVALKESAALVAAERDDDNGADSGSAYSYD